MQAHSLYFSTCSYVMQADPADRASWSELQRLLPCLRQSVSCYVCGNILSIPKGPPHKVCQHHVCSSCVGGKMRLKPSCSWCKDHGEFVENRQLRIIVLCFKKLCEYILSTPIGGEIMSQPSNGETNNLMKIFQEALDFSDDYDAPPDMMHLMAAHPAGRGRHGRGKSKQRVSNPNSAGEDTQGESSCSQLAEVDANNSDAACHLNGADPLSSNGSTQSEPVAKELAPKPSTSGVRRHSSRWSRKTVKAAPKRRTRTVSTDGSLADNHEMEKRSEVHSSPDRASPDRPSKRTRLASSSSSQLGESGPRRKTCRCAKNNQPSLLTCMGQRCPCYSSKLACVGCQCRGCRNPCTSDQTNEEELHHLSDSSGAML